MDSHVATSEYSKCYYRGGLQFFWAHIFGGGRNFGAVNLRGATMFGPSLLK